MPARASAANPARRQGRARGTGRGRGLRLESATVGRNRCNGSCLDRIVATIQTETLQPLGLQMIDFPSNERTPRSAINSAPSVILKYTKNAENIILSSPSELTSDFFEEKKNLLKRFSLKEHLTDSEINNCCLNLSLPKT